MTTNNHNITQSEVQNFTVWGVDVPRSNVTPLSRPVNDVIGSGVQLLRITILYVCFIQETKKHYYQTTAHTSPTCSILRIPL